MSRNNTHIFLRHGKLGLPYADHSEMPFNVFRDLGTGVLNTPINKDFAKQIIATLLKTPGFVDIQMICTSPSTRCVETAKLFALLVGIPEKDIQLVPELSEVIFDLDKIDQNGSVSNALERGDMGTINAAVFDAMLSGKGSEDVVAALGRVNTFLDELAVSHKNTLCITHDFLMRLIELRLRYAHFEATKVSLDDLNSTQRNGYLCGFSTNDSLNTFFYINNKI
ncbi:MAG: histidine phosphatase family protein [Patescibacteria group bacterium]|nr:histidine phosphatase family protein [Patescibacteria group bacterium]